MRTRAIIAPAALALASAVTPAFCYDEGTVTGGGSVEGQIVYKGPVQTRKIIPNKDVEVCGGGILMAGGCFFFPPAKPFPWSHRPGTRLHSR